MSAHPTNAYDRRGCRCDPCRAHHNARVKANRFERLAAGRLNHGTRSAYDAGCRCDRCLEARRAAYPAERANARLAYRGRKAA